MLSPRCQVQIFMYGFVFNFLLEFAQSTCVLEGAVVSAICFYRLIVKKIFWNSMEKLLLSVLAVRAHWVNLLLCNISQITRKI